MNHEPGRVEIIPPAKAPPAPSSPYGLGLRLAWWGRVSTEDQQDPTLSLPRQLHNSRAALPAGALIVAHYYNVESGRKDVALRGYARAHERFDIPIPRDGGIQELLAESKNPDRRFDAVICESIERVARRTYYGTKIEHDLEAAGVALSAADLLAVRAGELEVRHGLEVLAAPDGLQLGGAVRQINLGYVTSSRREAGRHSGASGRRLGSSGLFNTHSNPSLI